MQQHSLADSLVRAAAWSDGGAEFVYGDGTVLSFVDHMNTFVAVHTNPRSARKSTSTCTSCAEHATTHIDDKDDADRDMCFTAWTLSRYEAKVRAALAVYNSLAERPRLFATLLPQSPPMHDAPSSFQINRGSCGVWREPGPPMHTLLLEKRPDLFARHHVYGRVRDWLVTPHTEPTQATTLDTTAAASMQSQETHDTTTFSIHHVQANDQAEDASAAKRNLAAASAASRALPTDVPVGTILEFWCVLRRVRLTVAAHRTTFTVRWPAPVTRPDGSRLPVDVASWASHEFQNPSNASAAAASLLFTYVEQTFPVCDPPPTWRVMLAMALALDAELPVTSVMRSPDVICRKDEPNGFGEHAEATSMTSAMFTRARVPPLWKAHLYTPVEATPSHPLANADTIENDDEGEGEGWLGALPDPQHWGGELNGHRTAHPCRFSSLTSAQATHLAAPRTTRALSTMRSLHSSRLSSSSGLCEAHLCWMYDAPRCSTGVYVGEAGGGPPAVYWCLSSASSRVGSAGLPTRPDMVGVDVLAWVAEDGSVAHVRLEGQGYTVVHQRVASEVSQPVVYRMGADDVATAGRRLPPITAPLRCRVQLSCAVSDGDGAAPQHSDDVPRLRTATASARRSEDATVAMHGTGTSGECTSSGASDGVALSVTAVAVVDAVALWCEVSSTDGSEVCASTQKSTCATMAALTDLSPAGAARAASLIPFLTRQSAAAMPAGRWYPVRIEDARYLQCARYLASVAEVSVQLSQLNCAVSRAQCSSERPGTLSHPTAVPLAAYCKPACFQELPINTAAWTTKARSVPSAVGAVTAINTATAGACSSDGIVYLTSLLDGIGTFTAFTNGTMRGHFDDRTIVTLVPGANELDEAQLLATCVLRDARRCTLHVAQCREGHPLFRYLAYMLPFRRFVYLQAQNCGSGDGIDMAEHWHQQQQQHQEHELCQVSSIADVRHDDVLSVATTSRVEDTDSVSASRRGIVLTGACLRQEVCSGQQERAPRGGPQRWGVTDGSRTLQSLREKDAAEAGERQARLLEMLMENESLSHATRALLRN